MRRDDTGLPAGGTQVDTAAVALGLPEFVVLAAGGYAGEVRVWRVADGQEVVRFVASPR